MKRSTGSYVEGSENSVDYRKVFVVRVHQLLQLGYQRLHSRRYSQADEPSITGFLVSEMKAVLNDPPVRIQEWCDFFHVCDDPPENTGGRTGKRRKRVDMRIESGRRPRSEFRFEAKRLYNSNSAADYWGGDGIGCFLSGSYGPADPDVGMLGYVQSIDEVHWHKQLSAWVSKHSDSLSITEDGKWHLADFPIAGFTVNVTRHVRSHDASTVHVYHTLLRFC